MQLLDIFVETVDGHFATEEAKLCCKNDYLGDFEENTDDMTASKRRKLVYWTYISEIYGYLDPSNRLRIPHCITRETRGLLPDSEGAYMGFKEILNVGAREFSAPFSSSL